ncbi:MAG: hypothetical protein ACREUV_04010, partial [Burkholderiales bacterium]
RMHDIPQDDRLPTLVRFQNVLRKLWQTVLSSKQNTGILEGTDAQREPYLQSVQRGYVAPA